MSVSAILRWNVVTILAVVASHVAALASNVPASLLTRGHLATVAVALGLLCVGHVLLVQGRFVAGAALLIAGGLATFPLGLVSTLAGFCVFRMLARERESLLKTKRCLKCGYDLTGLTKPRCPECGCLFGFTESLEELGIKEDEVREK